MKRYHLFTECDGDKDYIYDDLIHSKAKHIEYAKDELDAVAQYVERHFAGQARYIAYDMLWAEEV